MGTNTLPEKVASTHHYIENKVSIGHTCNKRQILTQKKISDNFYITSSDLEYSKRWLQKLTVRGYSPNNSHHWSQICYKKYLSNMEFRNSLWSQICWIAKLEITMWYYIFQFWWQICGKWWKLSKYLRRIQHMSIFCNMTSNKSKPNEVAQKM